MWWWIIPVIVLSISFLVIILVLFKKIPHLRIIDTSLLKEEKVNKIKERIILQRVDRLKHEKLGKVGKAMVSVMASLSRGGRCAVQKLYAPYQYYKKLQQAVPGTSNKLDVEAVRKLLEEAENLRQQEEYVLAEKKYIEVISHNPKHIKAYEGLGNLYLEVKQYEQARETLGFTLRLSPDDASVNMSMAELEIAQGNPKTAVEYVRKAVAKRPSNPKYLDMYIESAFAAKMVKDASLGIAKIKEANPENAKITDFEERLSQLSSQEN